MTQSSVLVQKMDSTETSERQSFDNRQSLKHDTPFKKSELDNTYEDDFELLDPDKQEKSAALATSTNSVRTDVFHKPDPITSDDSDFQPEKGQMESSGESPMEKDNIMTDSHLNSKTTQPLEDPHSDDSEPEPEGDVFFTEDQQRAMKELMAQKRDRGNYSDEPPEYNVKERLKELNAELAMEPNPDSRHHRVGFKSELVDLVAPPPEVSDEDESPRKNPAGNGEKGKATGKGQTDKKKQFVVERDGKFDVVADNDLTASERAMFNVPDVRSKKSEKVKANTNNSNSYYNKENIHPKPPSKPRPNTANGHSHRSVRLSKSSRPQTASSNSSLHDFNYVSAYAMSESEKERAQKQAKLRQQQNKEKENQRKQEEEYRRQEAEDAFQSWLQQKREDARKKKQIEVNQKDGKEDKLDDDFEFETEKEGYPNVPYLEPFEPIIRLKSKENAEAFKKWLKEKQMQSKREKLLKKREEQEIKDGFYVRSRGECDKAYKEWLKKKHTELKRQKTAEKHRMKMFRSQIRKLRKQQMLAHAMQETQAFQYIDYYGYRF